VTPLQETRRINKNTDFVPPDKRGKILDFKIYIIEYQIIKLQDIA
jgi:hypothetical protein